MELTNGDTNLQDHIRSGSDVIQNCNFTLGIYLQSTLISTTFNNLIGKSACFKCNIILDAAA